MKLRRLFTLSLIFTVLSGLFSTLYSQEKGNKNVVTENRQLPSFTGIDIGGSIEVYILQTDEQSVRIETDENLQDNVITTVSGDILTIKSKGIKNPTKLNAYVHLPELIFLEAGGATDVKGEGLFETDELNVIAHGAASVTLDMDVNYLETIVSGAADLKLSGKAVTHKTKVSGAGNVKAKNLITEKCTYNVSGAGDASLNVTGEIKGETSGAGSVHYVGDPKTSIISKSDNKKSDKYSIYSENYYDSLKVKVGGIEVKVYEGDDSVRIVVGNKVLSVDNDGNVKFGRCGKRKFNGHWAGFDMGINGYVNPDFKMSFPKETEYMDLRMTKSVAVYINFFEQNIALSKNQKFGMVTGLGINWHNYRFSKNTRLNADSSELIGYIDKGISIRKTKLTNLYLNIPLLFEFQTNSWHKKNSFHFALGMVMGVRLSSHTKKYYDERNKEFEVAKYDPATDKYETVFKAVSPDNSKVKDFDDFYMNPFKWDATVRIGWGFINLFATYSVNTMFKKDKGPELYPWTVGITFVNL